MPPTLTLHTGFSAICRLAAAPFQKTQSGVDLFPGLSPPWLSFLIASLVITGPEFSDGCIARFITLRSTVNIDCDNEEVNIYLGGWQILIFTETGSRYFEGSVKCILNVLLRSSWGCFPHGCVSLASLCPIYVNGLKSRGMNNLGKWHCCCFIFEKKDTTFEILNNSHTGPSPFYVTDRDHVGRQGGWLRVDSCLLRAFHSSGCRSPFYSQKQWCAFAHWFSIASFKCSFPSPD